MLERMAKLQKFWHLLNSVSHRIVNVDERTLGILFTTGSIVLGIIFSIIFYVDVMECAKVDSEGGIFVYGMAMIFSCGFMVLGIFFGSIIWGIGIYKKNGKLRISKWEKITQGTLLVLSGSCIGLVLLQIILH